MKNSARTYVALFLLVVSILPAPILAAVTVESTINQDVYVTIDFSGIQPAIYLDIKANTGRFNATTIPEIIVRNLAQKNLKRVGWGYARVDYDDTSNSVRVAFHLGGSDIISFTVNKASMVRTYRVSTDWRKFKVDLSDGLSVDLAQYFDTPLSQWERTDRTDPLGVHPVYYHERQSETFFNMSFYFILPATAMNIQVEEETITYEVPPYAEDVFLDSPFLILAAILLITIIIVAYRKMRV